MNISDEAVEAAARKLHEIAPVHYYAQEFEDLSGNDMEEMREDIRQILEAAAPFIAREAVAAAFVEQAEVVQEVIDKFKHPGTTQTVVAVEAVYAYETIRDHLRAQATSYRAGEA